MIGYYDESPAIQKKLEAWKWMAIEVKMTTKRIQKSTPYGLK
jgi:hypothetical protein